MLVLVVIFQPFEAVHVLVEDAAAEVSVLPFHHLEVILHRYVIASLDGTAMDRFREVETLPFINRLVAVHNLLDPLVSGLQNIFKLSHPEQSLFQVVIVENSLHVLLVFQSEVVLVLSTHVLLDVDQEVIVESEAHG